MLRAFVRRALPATVRARVRFARRALSDRHSGLIFAGRRDPSLFLQYERACYERPFVDYPGQEAFAAAKRRNQAILASFLHGTIIDPGEVFSVWRLAPRPTARLGYGRAAALHGTTLASDIGGAICLLSTVLYNAALLAGMRVLEHHCHYVDNYGSRRYFEPGRDAAIEWAYQDLRFQNPHPTSLRLSVAMDTQRLWGSFHGDRPCPFDVEIGVGEPAPLHARVRFRRNAALRPGERRPISPPIEGFRVQTWRIVRHPDGREIVDDLGSTVHQPVPGVVDVGPPC